MRVLLALLSALLLSPAPAAAYIDPGTGSYAFQVIVATFAGLIYVMSQYWKGFLGLFSKNRPDAGDATPTGNPEHAPDGADDVNP